MTIFSFRNGYTFIANTRTASTAIHHLLFPHTDLVFYRPQFGKHLTFGQVVRCAKRIADCELARLFTFGIVREPVSWLYSWYRFRKRAGLKKLDHADRLRQIPDATTFDQFVEEACAAEPRPFAQIPPQSSYFRDARGRVGVDFVAVFENLSEDTRILAAYPPLSRLSGLGTLRLNSTVEDPSAKVNPFLFDQVMPLRGSFADDIDLYARAIHGEFRKIPEEPEIAEYRLSLDKREARENAISRILLHHSLGENECAERLLREFDVAGWYDEQIEWIRARLGDGRQKARQALA